MTKKDEWRRGAKDARQAFELLRARWPKAFPAKSHEVRPLANVTADLQEAFGWSRDYTKGVLMAWKAREAYCRAILLYPNRVKLDGSVIEDAVDDEACAMATARLERIAAGKAKAAERRAMEAAERAAVEAASQPPAPAPVPETVPEPLLEAGPSHPPVETPAPEPSPPRTRKLLTLGPAAKEALLKRGLATTEVVATIQRRAR